MGKLLIVLIALIASTSTFAEVTRLTCLPTDQRPPFQVTFGEGFALVNLKNNTYKIPYKEFYIDDDGDKRVVYENDLLRVNFTPLDKFVSIGTNPRSAYKIISGAYCK